MWLRVLDHILTSNCGIDWTLSIRRFKQNYAYYTLQYARQFLLRITDEPAEGVPAQRVINSKGELSGSWAFGSPDRMRQLLEAEGIIFSTDGRVDLKRYGWDPSRDLSEEELGRILGDADTTSVAVNTRLLSLLRNDPASPMRGTERAE